MGRGPGSFYDDDRGEPDWESYADYERDTAHDTAYTDEEVNTPPHREGHPNRQVGRERFGS